MASTITSNYGKEKLSELLQSKNWELDQNLRIFDTYLSSNERFNDLIKIDSKFKIFETKPIAYFCLEYGFVDWLQIYSGGLGILAGDYIKQASDSGIPVIGIGLFYHQGYLHQDFGPDGMQLENYIHQDPLDYNMSVAKDKEGRVE
jgi:glucan phosphorylase